MLRRAVPTPDDHDPGGQRRRRLSSIRHTSEDVERKTGAIYRAMLGRSQQIRDPNFTSLGADDLRLLFELYDGGFFESELEAMIRADGSTLDFRLSGRMTRSGGTTSMLRRPPAGPGRSAAYEITVSTTLLFGTFRAPGRVVTVGGLACRDRLEALQRIFEHELLHLVEFLGWGQSSCSRANFHALSRHIFGHAGVRHDLVTPRERAAEEHGIRVGDRVSFEHEGRRRFGRVNRITRRATVLVDDPGGMPYSDGRTYATFYVPLPRLRREAGPG